MPTSIMQKNYSHCPLKKRPVNIIKEEKIKQETDLDMEPENLSTKPEDLSRTGNYPSKILTPPQTEESQSSSSPSPSPRPVPEIRIPTPTYPLHPYYTAALRKSSPAEDAPLNLSPAASPRSEPIAALNPINWHKPLTPAAYPGYLPFPGYPLAYPSEAYSALYHQQFSPSSRSSEPHSPYTHRDSSVSPPSYHASLVRTRDNSVSPPIHRGAGSGLVGAPHRYMPYHLGHHHQLMMPVDQSSLSPTSSHASFNSFLSSRRSLSPASNAPSTPEDLSHIPAFSVLMEKSTSSANIQKSAKKATDADKSSGQAPRYQCPDCGKSYSTYSGLSKHQQFHCAAAEGNQAKKTFVCKYCEKQYASLGALKMHIRTHTLPCKCHLCGKAFSRPWLLQGHIRTHTGEKPFSCQFCHRAFADRSNLRAHLQTHSDVKKYSCQTCSKTFSRMSLLTKHTEGGCPGIQIAPSGPMHGKDISVY